MIFDYVHFLWVHLRSQNVWFWQNTLPKRLLCIKCIFFRKYFINVFWKYIEQEIKYIDYIPCNFLFFYFFFIFFCCWLATCWFNGEMKQLKGDLNHFIVLTLYQNQHLSYYQHYHQLSSTNSPIKRLKIYFWNAW